MAKILITLFCAFIACVAAKPQFIASFAAAPLAAAPVAPVVPAAYAATPLAYTNLPLDAAYASSSIDVRQNYASAILPASYAVPAVYSAPVAPVAAPVAPVAPLKYTAAAPVLL